MKIARPKTEKWHNYEEGDCAKPIDRDGSNKAYFKKDGGNATIERSFSAILASGLNNYC